MALKGKAARASKLQEDAEDLAAARAKSGERSIPFEAFVARLRVKPGGGDRVRTKLARLNVTEKDVADAVRWARGRK